MLRRRLVIGVLLAPLMTAFAGACYHAISFRTEMGRSPRPRRLVSVSGGVRLNLHCTGQGAPTVVLESGWGDSLDAWSKVQPEISAFARVCSYDRAGYGYSDPAPEPRTGGRMVAELRAALGQAGEKPPFVLVGHSFGGFLVRIFHGRHPDEVAGLVLIDSVQEDQYRLLPEGWRQLLAAMRQRNQRLAFWAPITVGLGMMRLKLRMEGYRAPGVLLQVKYLQARASELESIEVSAEEARASGSLGDKPLIVLTAGNPVDAALRTALSEADQRAFQRTWRDLQMRLTRQSRQGRQIVAAGAGHDIAGERPEDVVNAVWQLVAVLP
ncbi:MAG: alpha/beta fold hydrolase [Bryobacterales bacterium]|nr:alpha/beta fold hydrolase [Bryobacterales bacterium]